VKDVLKIRLLTNETRGIVFAGQVRRYRNGKLMPEIFLSRLFYDNFFIIHQYFFLEELDF